MLLAANAGAATYTIPAATPTAAAKATSDEYGQRVAAAGVRTAATPLHVAGGGAAWSSLGPPGGDVTDVAASPTDAGVVLAGTAPNGSFGGSLYRSTDAGATWSVVPALAGLSVFNIAYAGDGAAYASTMDSVWKSTDAGASWSQLALGIGANDAVFGVAIDPADDSNVWACITAAIGNQTVNVMQSTDGGATWQDRTPPDHTAGYNCGAVAIDPADSQTVVVGFRGDFGGGEVWVSADGGATWTSGSTGLPSEPINAITFAGSRLLIGGGMAFGSQYLGVYASDDLGQTWTSLSDEWPLAIANAIAVDPNDPDTILAATGGAGLNRSTDGGATWEFGVSGTTGLTAASVRYVPGDDSQVLLGASSLAVFKSTDAAESFTQSASGISELALYSIAANPTNAAEIAVAFQGENNGGVFSSADGGATWTLESNLPATRYSKVGFSPDGTLYAISSGPTTIAQEGLYRREADDSWTNLGPDQGPYFESDLDSMRFSVNDPNLILLGGADFGVAGFAGTVWRSTDAGATWTKVYMSSVDYDKIFDIEIVEDGTDQQVSAVYDNSSGGGAQQGGAIRSTDGGATWALANTGLPAISRIPKLCQTTDEPPALYLSATADLSTGSVFRSDDGGASWTPTGWNDPSLIYDIACDPFEPSTLYIGRGGTEGYVARSDDGGVSFTAFASGLDEAGSPSELVAVKDSGATQLLLATSKGSFAEGGVTDRIFADGFDP